MTGVAAYECTTPTFADKKEVFMKLGNVLVYLFIYSLTWWRTDNRGMFHQINASVVEISWSG